MDPEDRYGRAPDHERRTARMLAETFGVLLLLASLAAAMQQSGRVALALVPAVLLGFWMQRLYVVGHEAAHGKLYPDDPRRNALFGQLALLPILVPLPVFRKIHRFHHGCNRRDARTSALDTFVFRHDGPLQRAWAWTVWLLAVLAGGWFWHSVVSILLFLGLPVSLARRISPAFHGWSTRDRLASLAVFAVAVGIQVGLATLGVWTVVFAVPIAVFAWVYSVQLYVYHYATTLGPEVTLHARRLHGPGVSWWLLNLNEHDTHHREPRLVWYALPTRGRALPEGFEGNQRHTSFVRALLDQLRGPTVVVEDP